MTTPTARYTDEILVEWYSTVARWRASAQGESSICAMCTGSPFTSQLGLRAWPHTVVHPLVERLGAAIASDSELEAVQLVLDARHSDILDVLEHCVSEELDQFVRAQALEAVMHFERNPSALD